MGKNEYDQQGNPIKISFLDKTGNEVRSNRIKYNDHRLPVSIEDGRRVNRISYNDYGYLTSVTNVYGHQKTVVYDKYNRPETVKYDNGLITRYIYDASGQLCRTDLMDGAITLQSSSRTFDGNGDLIACTDDRSSKRFDRDEKGRVSREYEADGSVINYAYDNIGRLNKIIDQNGNPITFEWGKYGHSKHITAENQLTEYLYDENGILTEIKSRFEGAKKTDMHRKLKYDDLDRIVEVDYGNGQTEQFRYDSWGRKLSTSRSDGQTASYTYDHFGRLVQLIEGGVTRTYEYDAWGQRTKRTVSSQDGFHSEETREYDKTGRLVKIAQNNSVVEYGYDKYNRVIHQLVNGCLIEFEYNKMGQLLRKAIFDKNGKILSELKYVYSGNGTLTGREANGETVTYRHDPKGQLIAVMNEANQCERYVYDPAGNILSKTVRGRTTHFTYDKANQLVSMDDPCATIQYSYDGAGRMVREGEREYQYGWLNKVTSVVEHGDTIGEYTYGLDYQIASSIWKGQTDTYVWDCLALIGRSDVDIMNVPAMTGGDPIVIGEQVVFNDQLGSSLGCFDGKKYSPVQVSSFGVTEKENETAFYAGKPYIQGLGYNFLYRNYRPDLGKWQTSDLIGYPDGWNNLAYCNNGVVSSFDRYGLAVGDIYPSADAAASAWGNQFNGSSISSNTESASAIYANGDGYSYTEPIAGSEGSVGNSTSDNPNGNPPVPDGKTADSYIHSHGGYDPKYDSDQPSDSDKEIAKNNEVPEYITTPDGKLLKYDPKTGKITEISKDMPYDPNHPNPVNPKKE